MNRRQFLASAAVAPVAAVWSSGRVLRAAQAVPRLGASTACFAGMPLPDAIAHLERIGFGTLELITYTGARHSVGDIPGFDFAASSPAERDRVFAMTRGFQHITGHLPFQGFSLFSGDDQERQSGLARIRAALDGLAFLKGELGVMHVGSPPKGRTFRDIWQPMVDTLRMLGDYAAERRLKLGVETMQPDSARDYAQLFADVRHPAVGAAIDTGHIRGSRDIGLPPERRDSDEARARFNDVLNSLVADLGGKVVHFHISDVSASGWVDHKRIGSGIIDFPRLFATIRRIGYRGVFVLELEEADKLAAVEQSKAYVERLLGGMGNAGG
jgi:sugar phosphate isomerase/epimerase